MPVLLDRVPFPGESAQIAFRDERILIRADQIIAWVSLTIRRITIPNPLAIPFPVVIDTGLSHTMAIRRSHLISWAGLDPSLLGITGAVRDRGQRIPLRSANIWFHSNRCRSRDVDEDRPAFGLAAPRGIAVYPEGDFPRLPILGLRVIAENNLILNVDGPRREASLRTAPRWRVLG